MAWLIAAASFVLSCVLVARHPILYWADPYARLVFRDDLLVDRWLPLLQLVVSAVTRVTANLAALRLVLAALASLALVAAFAWGSRLANRRVGLLFAALLGTSPMFVALAIVPYQEVLFLGLAFLGLTLHVRRSEGRRIRYLAIAAFNLACLTRYEGWLLVLVLTVDELVTTRSLVATLRILVSYGLLALAWLALWALGPGLAALGHSAGPVVPITGHARELVHQVRWQIGSLVLCGLALVGVAAALVRRDGRRAHLVLIGFLAADVALVLLAHPYSPGNLRETFFVVVLGLAYAAVGLDLILAWALARLPSPARVALTVAALVALAAPTTIASVRFVAASSNEPSVRVPYEVAQWFNSLPLGERKRFDIALLSGDDLQRAVLAVYSGIQYDQIQSVRTVPTNVDYVVQMGFETPRRDSLVPPAGVVRLQSALIWRGARSASPTRPRRPRWRRRRRP